MHSAERAATACRACKIDFYSVVGSSDCLPCVKFSVSNSDNTQCLCDRGFTGDAMDTGCAMCVAGKYKQALGSAGCEACPTDYYAPAQSTMASACYPAPKVVFVLAMGGDISVSDMTEKLQAQMLDNIAKSLQMDSSLFKMVSITNGMRRLLAVNVYVQVIVQDDAAASATAGRAQAVAAAAASGASDAGFSVTVTASPIIVPAPLPIVSTPPAPPPSSPDVLSPPPKGPLPVTTNVPVAVNSPPSEKNDLGTSKTGIIAACIASAVLFFIVTSILLYRRHAKRKQSAKSAGIVPSFLSQQPANTAAEKRLQPLPSTYAGQDLTLEDSAAGVQPLYPQDQPVNCRTNERPLAQACSESSPVSEQRSGRLVALKTPAPEPLYLSILPAPAAPILSDSAPASSGSSENLVANLYKKAIAHSAAGREARAPDLTPQVSDEMFQAAPEFSEPAFVENRCQDSLRFSALDASVVLLRMLLEFCAAYRFLLPCACGFDGR